MQKTGFIIIMAIFVVLSVVSIQDTEKVDWTYYSIFFAIGLFGVVMVQVGIRHSASHEDHVKASMQKVEEGIEGIVNAITKLDTQQDFDVYQVPKAIDALFPQHLDAFVSSRESIKNQYSLNAYADVMSHFAAGERFLNHIWSAASDGYIDEVKAYLPRCREQFEMVKEKLDELRKGAGG